MNYCLSVQMAVPRTPDYKEVNSLMAFIPTTLHDNVIELTSVKLDRSKSDKSTTMMIGFITPTYVHKMWKKDVDKWKGEFPNTSVCDLELHTKTHFPANGEAQVILDDTKANEAVNNVLPIIKQIPDNTPLRMIVLGPAFHPFLFDTIKHLLKEWRTPDGKERRFKKLNCIISNTKKESEFFDFCRKLCLSGVCQSVQFYNTDYYRPFGHYNEGCA
jgi:hypothetical protein